MSMTSDYSDETMTAPASQRELPAPGLADKLRRGLWNVVQATLYRLIPTPFFAPRRALLRLFGAQIADGVHAYPGAKIWAPWNLVMEQHSCIADRAICYNVATVRIGRDAIVSQGAYLCTPSHDFRRADFPLTAAAITIGENAWVATEAFVGPGVSVGRNAVIGARAVVMRNVPDSAVVVGNPARVIGNRTIDN